MGRALHPAIHHRLGFRALGALLRPRRGGAGDGGALLLGFTAATAIHAVAHATMALSAGLLGQALLSRQPAAGRPLVEPPSVEGIAGLLHGVSPVTLCFLGLSAALVKSVFGSVSTYVQQRVAFRVGRGVRREVTDSILARGQSSAGIARVNASLALRVREVERGVDEGLLATARAAAQLVPLAAALIFLSSSLALLSLAALVPFALVLAAARRRFRRVHGRAARLAEGLHAEVDELVRHLDLWRTFGAGGNVSAAVERASSLAETAAARAEASRTALSGANEVLAALALLVGVVVVEAHDLPIGDGSLVAFAAVFFLMYRPLRDLGDARARLDRAAEALDHLGAIAQGATPVEAGTDEACTKRTPAWPLAALEVHGVHVVRDAWSTPSTSLLAEPGQVVAVIGPTGSGKSTLLRCLLGLEAGSAGTVLYGGRELTHAGVGPNLRPFAWVPQEPAIVAGTVAANVALGMGDAAPDAARIAAALDELGAGALASRDHLSAGGPELSGGERQLVALARAIASGQPVLLLDEPTAGLDPAAQARVLDALRALRGRRTVILVTHRTEPLAIADAVVELGAAQNCASRRGSFSKSSRMFGTP